MFREPIAIFYQNLPPNNGQLLVSAIKVPLYEVLSGLNENGGSELRSSLSGTIEKIVKLFAKLLIVNIVGSATN